MKATHTDYLHPGHLRVETGGRYTAWTAFIGWFERTALCMGPGCSDYSRLNRPGLPPWPGGRIVDGIEVPAE